MVIIYALYVFLAGYNAGNMTSLQLQHYQNYYFVGKDNFGKYMQENNKSAFVPAVLPGILMLLLSIFIVFWHPVFVTTFQTILLLMLNLIAFFSTINWQRKLQSEMAHNGFNESKIKLLIATNWIRTICFNFIAIISIWTLVIAAKF